MGDGLRWWPAYAPRRHVPGGRAIAPPPDPGRTAPLIRVGVVDDHPAIVDALAVAIKAAADLTLVGTASTVDEALALAATTDVLVSDLQLDGHAEGLDLLDAIHRRPAPPAVLILSGFSGASLVRAAIDHGAAGYLDKRAPLPAVLDAIRTVHRGGTVFTAGQLRASMAAPRPPSTREREVLAILVRGATNAEIGAQLGLTEKTVESHLRRMFDRYGVLSRTELAVRALDEGWAPTAATRA